MIIKSTNLANARMMDFYQVMSLTANYLSKEDLEALQLTPYATEFNAAFSQLDKAVKQAQKTGYTESIVAADDNRDNVYTGFRGALRSMMRFPDADIASSAEALQVITDKYGESITRLPQREESAILSNIVAELQSEANAALLQTTGLNIWVEKLDEANKAFDDLYVSRTEKEAQFIVGLTRTERGNMQTAFEKLAQAIEAYAFINGEEAYKTLADRINTEVANVQQAAKARATLSEDEASPASADL